MDFDFLAEFNKYSTIELLKIIRRPANYQKAAVEAATIILGKRNISHQEYEEVEKFYNAIDLQDENLKEKTMAYKQKVTNVLDPFLIPDDKVRPFKWLSFLLLIIAIQYLWELPTIVRYFIFLISDNEHFFEITTVIYIVQLLFSPIIFWLLLKKRPWGWILLFGESVFSSVLLLLEISEFLYMLKLSSWAPWNTIWFAALRGLFLYFLLKKEITGFFGIGRSIKERTFAVSIALALLFIGSVHYFY